MLFSQESSQAIFEMGNVELIELKTSLIERPSCLHYVFKGTILCQCGKHIRPDLEMMRRIKAALNSWKDHASERVRLLQAVANTALLCGKNITTQQKTHCGVLQKAKENFYVDLVQMAKWWGEILGPYCANWYLSCNAAWTKGKFKNPPHLRSVDENKQAPPLPQRPGYQDAKKA